MMPHFDMYSPTMSMSPTMDAMAPQIDYFRPRGAVGGMHEMNGMHHTNGLVLRRGAHPTGALALGDQILQPQIQNYQMSNRFPNSSMGFLPTFMDPMGISGMLPILGGALLALSPMLLKKNKTLKKHKQPVQIAGGLLLAYGLYHKFM